MLPWLAHFCRQCGLPLSSPEASTIDTHGLSAGGDGPGPFAAGMLRSERTRRYSQRVPDRPPRRLDDAERDPYRPGLICGACLKKPPAFDRTYPLWHYRPPVPGLIHALKFQGRLECARLLGEIMAEQLGTLLPPDCLLPVPLHPARYRERGFNQALEIARPLTKQLGLPLTPRLCRRTRFTPPQYTRDAQGRRKNLRGAFQASKAVDGCRIAVVDDVMTTGTTAHEVAAALKRAGASRVEVWILARADRQIQ